MVSLRKLISAVKERSEKVEEVQAGILDALEELRDGIGSSGKQILERDELSNRHWDRLEKIIVWQVKSMQKLNTNHADFKNILVAVNGSISGLPGETKETKKKIDALNKMLAESIRQSELEIEKLQSSLSDIVTREISGVDTSITSRLVALDERVGQVSDAAERVGGEHSEAFKETKLLLTEAGLELRGLDDKVAPLGAAFGDLRKESRDILNTGVDIREQLSRLGGELVPTLKKIEGGYDAMNDRLLESVNRMLLSNKELSTKDIPSSFRTLVGALKKHNDRMFNTLARVEKDLITRKEGADPHVQSADGGIEVETPPLPEVKADGDNLIGIRSCLNRYDRKLGYLIENDHEKNRGRIEEASKAFFRWKGFLLAAVNNYENEVVYEYLEVLERYNAPKDRMLLLFPFDARDTEKSLRELSLLTDGLRDIRGDNVQDALLSLKKMNVRNCSKLDFRVDDDLPTDGDHGVFRKKSLNTLILISKRLEELRGEMLALLSWVSENEGAVCSPLKEFDTRLLLNCLIRIDHSDRDAVKKVDEILEEADKLIKDNFNHSMRASETADRLGKKYFNFLGRNLFRVVNELDEAEKEYLKYIKAKGGMDGDSLKGWGEIYPSMKEVLLTFLSEFLNIEPIECKRGDMLDMDLHLPHMEAEGDEELDNDTVKRVVNRGFRLSEGALGEVVKPVDVIVVRNLERSNARG